MMQTGIARHAPAVVLPFWMILALNISYRTYPFAFSAAVTLVLIYGEMLVGNEMVMEETAEKTTIQLWECTLVKMLATAALANPFRELLKFYGCIANLLTFTEFLVEIHEWKSDIALWHYNGIRGI